MKLKLFLLSFGLAISTYSFAQAHDNQPAKMSIDPKLAEIQWALGSFVPDYPNCQNTWDYDYLIEAKTVTISYQKISFGGPPALFFELNGGEKKKYFDLYLSSASKYREGILIESWKSQITDSTSGPVYLYLLTIYGNEDEGIYEAKYSLAHNEKGILFEVKTYWDGQELDSETCQLIRL